MSEPRRPFIELGQRMVRGEVPSPPVAQLIGFKVVSIDPGRCTMELEASTARHANPMGTLHGGILCDVADAALGMAWASELAEGESFTTLELKINFLKPIWNARLRAEARVIRRGRTVGLAECDVRDEKGDLVAYATCTLMTLRGDQAAGR